MASKNNLESLLELSKKLFNSIFTTIQSKITSVISSIGDKLGSFIKTTNNLLNNLGKNLTFNNVKDKITDVNKLFSDLNNQLSFVNDINDTKVALQRMGEVNVDETASSINSLSRKMKEAPMSIALAANSITKQMGGTMTENIDLIEKAYNKGANLNGDMIENLKKYPNEMQEMGIPLKSFLALMAQSAQDGIVSDKAIDSLKNAGLSLQNFGKVQEEALGGLGLGKSDLIGKSTWESVDLILQTMDKAGLTVQEKQSTLMDLFNGSGKEVDLGFIQSLAKGMPNFDAQPEIKNTNNASDSFISGIQNSVADFTGDWMPLIDIVDKSSGTILSVMSTYEKLNKVLKISDFFTKLWTGTQWLLNIAMNANPIGIIVIAIGVLVALIAVAINKYDEWGAALLQFLGPIGWVVNGFMSIKNNWDSIVNAFKTDGITGGLKRIHIVLMDTFLKPLQQILEMITKYDPTGLSGKLLKSVKDIRSEFNLVTPGEKEIKKDTKVNPVALAGVSVGGLSTKITDNLYAKTETGNTSTKNNNTNKTKEDISKVSGQGNQIKKIDIKIDSFNKGGINISNAGGNGMTPEQLERWMKEMFMRIIIDAENV